MDYEAGEMQSVQTDRFTVEVERADGTKGSSSYTRNASTHEFETELVDNDGFKVALGADFQDKSDEHQKVGAKLAVELPDMGGVQAFMNFGAERKFFPNIQAKTSHEDEIEGDISLAIQKDTHIGASMTHEGGETKKLNVQAVYQGYDKVDAWVRADTMNKWVSTGCSKQEGERFNHTYEAVYGYGDKSKAQGIMDSPVWIRFGARYNMSDASSLVSNYLFAKHWEKNTMITHKINDNVKLGVHYHYDQRRTGVKDRSAHEFGYSLHYEV